MSPFRKTLINTLFNTTLYPPKEYPGPHAERPRTIAIQSISAGMPHTHSSWPLPCITFWEVGVGRFWWWSFHLDIEEAGVRLKLKVVDTPGYGDFVNNSESWKPILENIEARFDGYLEQENRVNRAKIVDNRIHACIYFIEPTGHSFKSYSFISLLSPLLIVRAFNIIFQIHTRLKLVDVEFMKCLHTKVNLIPVIAKADTMTDDEITAFKQRVSRSIMLAPRKHDIPSLIMHYVLLSRSWPILHFITLESMKLVGTKRRTKRPLPKTRRSW